MIRLTFNRILQRPGSISSGHAIATAERSDVQIQRLIDKRTFERFAGVLRQSMSSTEHLCKASVRHLGSSAGGLGAPMEGLDTAQCENVTHTSRHQSYQRFAIDCAIPWSKHAR